MGIGITDDAMTLEIDTRVVAGHHAAADGNGAWIVWACPAHLFDRDQAIAGLAAAELLELGYADNDRLAVAVCAPGCDFRP